MSLSFAELRDLPSPFYRAAVKALIFDDQQRLLVIINADGMAELPGGGWEHNETLEECVRREMLEEIGVEPKTISPVIEVARGQSVNGWRTLRLLVRVAPASTQFVLGDGMQAARFVTKDEMLGLTFNPADAGIQNITNSIWSESQDTYER